MADAEFTGRVYAVTGGSSGIGAACVTALAARGARVVFCGLDDAAGAAVAAATGGAATYRHADVRQGPDMAALVAACVERHGRLDGAVNAAGVSHHAAKAADIPAAVWDDVITVNAGGVFRAMQAEIPALLASGEGGGAIVNIASILGEGGAPWMAAYGASKHAVIGLTLSAARDYAAAGLRINCVAPGPVATPMLDRALADIGGDRTKYAGGFPPAGPGRAEQVAAAVLFLLGDAAQYVNGAVLRVDGATAAG